MSKKCPECQGKGGFDLIDGKEVPSVAWCLDSSHGRACPECGGTGYSPEKVESKENNMSGHGKIVCSKCGVLIAQCRCIEGHNNIEYRVCDKCKNPEKDKLETLEDRLSNPKSIEDVLLQCGLGGKDVIVIASVIRQHVKEVAEELSKPYMGRFILKTDLQEKI